MPTSELKLLIEQAVRGAMPAWYVSLLYIAAVGLIMVGGAWLISFSQERGRAAAISAAFAQVLDQLRATTKAVEEIKSTVTGDLWIKQKRIDLKFQCYSQIVEHLGEAAMILHEAIRFVTEAPKPAGAVGEEYEEAIFSRYLARIEPAAERVRRFSSVARLAVAPQVRTLLSTFADEWNRVSTKAPLSEQLIPLHEIVYKAWIDVLDFGRADLFGEEREADLAARA